MDTGDMKARTSERFGGTVSDMSSPIKIRHLTLFSLCLMAFILYIDRVNISVAGPFMRKEMGLSPTQLGVIFSAFAYSYAFMQIPGGWLADKFGPRASLAVLSALWSVATVMTGVATGVSALIVWRFLVGVGEGGAFAAATRAFLHWMPISRRGFAQGLTHGASRLGGAVTPPIVVAIVIASGWRQSFLALGVASLAWTVGWLLFFRDSPADHRWMTREELVELGFDSTRPIEPARSLAGIASWSALSGSRSYFCRWNASSTNS